MPLNLTSGLSTGGGLSGGSGLSGAGGLYGVASSGGSGAAPTDLAALAWQAAVVGAGGSVSAGRLAAVSSYITALKNAGIWTLLDRLFILGPENASITQQATINIVNLAVASSNTATVSTKGVTGNGTTTFFNTGFAPNGSGNYTGAAASLFVYTQAFVTLAIAGAASGSAESSLYAPFSDSNFYPRLNDEGGAAGGPFTTGFFVGDRSAGVVTGAHNGVDLSPNSVAAIALPGFAVCIGALNSSGTPTNFNASTFGIWGAGGPLGATKRAALYTATNAYLTTVGAL